jgi:vacuolar ATPase assembly integral membrane protein VMA21
MENSKANESDSRDVIIKLLAFTLAMIVVPIGSYYATVNTLFKGMLSHYYHLPFVFVFRPLLE